MWILGVLSDSNNAEQLSIAIWTEYIPESSGV